MPLRFLDSDAINAHAMKAMYSMPIIMKHEATASNTFANLSNAIPLSVMNDSDLRQTIRPSPPVRLHVSQICFTADASGQEQSGNAGAYNKRDGNADYHGNEADCTVIILYFLVNFESRSKEFKNNVPGNKQNESEYAPSYHVHQAVVLYDGVSEDVCDPEQFSAGRKRNCHISIFDFFPVVIFRHHFKYGDEHDSA